MNVDRMRRNIYRSVPDRKVFTIDLHDAMRNENYWSSDQYNYAIESFKKAMRIKHGDDVPIKVWEDDMMGRYPGDRVFVFRAYPERRTNGRNTMP